MSTDNSKNSKKGDCFIKTIGIKDTTVKLGLVVATLLTITLFILHSIGIHEGWPAFLLILFFFESGAKRENLKKIFCGATIGLISAIGIHKVVELLAPILGKQISTFTMVFLTIFLLIALGDISHTLFNNYAFCYFTVASIYSEQETLTWLLILYVGGTFLIVGVSYFLKIIHKHRNHNESLKM